MLHGEEGAGGICNVLKKSYSLPSTWQAIEFAVAQVFHKVFGQLDSCVMQVKDHARQLLEKYIGKPFLDAKYAGKAARMEAQDVEEGLQWLEERFHVVRCEDDELPSVDWVLGLARAAVLRCFCSTVQTCQSAISGMFPLIGSLPLLQKAMDLAQTLPSWSGLLQHIQWG